MAYDGEFELAEAQAAHGAETSHGLVFHPAAAHAKKGDTVVLVNDTRKRGGAGRRAPEQEREAIVVRRLRTLNVGWPELVVRYADGTEETVERCSDRWRFPPDRSCESQSRRC